MLSKVKSCAIIGLEGQLVEVEADLGFGWNAFNIVGLPDKAVEEAKERIISAFKNSGLEFPFRKRLVVNLAPADVKKAGPSYDLSMAIGIAAVSGQISSEIPEDALFVGELSLDGQLRDTKGILPIALFAKEQGFRKLFLPAQNLSEAELVENLELYPLNNLRDLICYFRGEHSISPQKSRGINLEEKQKEEFEVDMAFIKGQEHAKRALEIAAAGGHNLLMVGPPGAGKTLLARTLPSILPRMSKEEILEVTKIYSIAGFLPKEKPLILQRPFRSPHHTSSGVALVGGGQFPKPGEISLAHRGVLFLDEFPEFSRSVLENLRQPLEDGFITVSRAQASLTFPARFTLIASQNPCPCGFFGEPDQSCHCTPSQINKYQKRISGPLLDRIDLYVKVPPLETKDLTKEAVAETSSQIRKRVEKARRIQEIRYKDLEIFSNSELSPQQIKKYISFNKKSLDLLAQAINQLRLSARGYHRILKIARTIADLADSSEIQTNHLAEALQYRVRDYFDF
jgi:magnesium chelatase family protein